MQRGVGYDGGGLRLRRLILLIELVSVISRMLLEGRIRGFRKRSLTNRTVSLRTFLFGLQTRRHTALPLIIMFRVRFKITAVTILDIHLSHILLHVLDIPIVLVRIRISSANLVRRRALELAAFREAPVVGVGYLAFGLRDATGAHARILARMLLVMLPIIVLIGRYVLLGSIFRLRLLVMVVLLLLRRRR